MSAQSDIEKCLLEKEEILLEIERLKILLDESEKDRRMIQSQLREQILANHALKETIADLKCQMSTTLSSAY